MSGTAKASASQGAKEIVSKFSASDLGFTKLCKIEDVEALIDAHLEPLLRAAEECAMADRNDAPAMQHALLAELEKWKPGR